MAGIDQSTVVKLVAGALVLLLLYQVYKSSRHGPYAYNAYEDEETYKASWGEDEEDEMADEEDEMADEEDEVDDEEDVDEEYGEEDDEDGYVDEEDEVDEEEDEDEEEAFALMDSTIDGANAMFAA